ncbi:hypothetical protein E3N88_15273 [Mikania micrantha]|uniref:Uncharacterized protein n=1 Tax=Mikania micrantha TaxID=192012 RepID=A0A5N6NX75_9ASTR|nr:hypothetical protein E3N88_15273 [Mikania micrantha]
MLSLKMKHWTSLESLLLQKLSLIVGAQELTLMMIQSVGAQETIVSQMTVGQMAVKAQRKKKIRLLQFRVHRFQMAMFVLVHMMRDVIFKSHIFILWSPHIQIVEIYVALRIAYLF